MAHAGRPTTGPPTLEPPLKLAIGWKVKRLCKCWFFFPGVKMTPILARGYVLRLLGVTVFFLFFFFFFFFFGGGG